jgi:preprotein translocase subunit YajC
MTSLSSFLLMAQPQSANGSQGGFDSMIPTIGMFAVIIIIFYFFMIRPQKKRQQEHQKMIDGLRTGDKVITTSGMHGEIESVNDKTFVLKIDTVRFTFEKSAIVSKSE